MSEPESVSANDAINTRFLVNKVSESVRAHLEGHLFEPRDDEALKKTIAHTLEGYKVIGAIKDFTPVTISEVKWKEMYPKWVTRQMAKLGSKIFKRRDRKPTIWHHIFPFTVGYDDALDIDRARMLYQSELEDNPYEWRTQEEEADLFAECVIKATRTDSLYYAYIDTPHGKIRADVTFQPIQPIKFIQLRTVISQRDIEEGSIGFEAITR